MPRAATKPIPRRLQAEFYTSMWELAYTGRFYRAVPPSAFGTSDAFFRSFGSSKGASSDVSRRHGLVILWSTAAALRFHEMANLKVGDVDIEESTVFVKRGKKSKSETIIVDRKLVHCTSAWHRRVQIDSPLLLPNERGGKLNNKIFNRDVCGPLSEIFGIKISHHSFRDTACDLGFEMGSDARAVQRLLGHRSAATTQVYAEKSAPAPIQIPLFTGGDDD